MQGEEEILERLHQFSDTIWVVSDTPKRIEYALKAFREPVGMYFIDSHLQCFDCEAQIPYGCLFIDQWCTEQHLTGPYQRGSHCYSRQCRECAMKSGLWYTVAFLVQNPCLSSDPCAAFHITSDIRLSVSERPRDYNRKLASMFETEGYSVHDSEHDYNSLLEYEEELMPSEQFTPGTRESRIQYKVNKQKKSSK
jgi:hypothetical protein